MNIRIPLFALALVSLSFGATTAAQTTPQRLPDAITADSKHYTVEFENDIVRVLRVRLGAGDSTPRHAHSAYCAIGGIALRTRPMRRSALVNVPSFSRNDAPGRNTCA